MRPSPKSPGVVYVLLMVLSLFALWGCSGSDNGGTGETGELAISLTDAQGDFTNYTVDVVSITLTKANGAVVETLPVSTRVDFSQYTEMTEFLTIAAVPFGAYKQATLTLDYTNADIHVETATGESVPVTSIVDESGNPLGETDVSVFLENRSALVIAPGITSHMTLDFDLKASNTVAFDFDGNAEVTVDPSLIAEVGNSHSPKSHRLRGLLSDVDTDADRFMVSICPFNRSLSNHGRFGTMTVLTDNATLYDINGDLLEGSEGLDALSLLDMGTPVIVIGNLAHGTFIFKASEVYAGTSVPGGDLDVAKGNVISRDGNTLTLIGATLIQSGGEIEFSDTIMVTIGETTVVKKRKSAELFSIDDISVGQNVSVFGTITVDDESTVSIDATEGSVCLAITTLYGTATDTVTPDADMVIALEAINKRDISMFDFTGTGSAPETDADPALYELETGSLDIDGFLTETPLKAYGFVAPFGSAPVDFTALSLVNLNDVTAFIKFKWSPPTSDAFSLLSDTAIVVNLNSTKRFHHIGQGGMISDLGDSEAPPVIVPSENGVYVIMHKRTHGVYTDFAQFIETVSSMLNGHTAVNTLFASGSYTATTETFTADYMVIKLR